MEINEMNLAIHKGWYNKSRVAEDGVTHIIDTSKQYPFYSFEAQKNYFSEDRIEVINGIIADLHEVIRTLEQMRDNSKEEQREI